MLRFVRTLCFRAGWFYLAYLVGAEVGYFLTFPDDPFVALWPPSGIYLAVLVRSSPRHWVGFLAAALAASLTADVARHGVPWQASVAFWLANTVEAVVGAALLRRWFGPGLSLLRLKEVLALVGVVALAAGPLAATLGAAACARWLSGLTFARAWPLWWLSSLVSWVVMAPVVLTGLSPDRPLWSAADWRRYAEALALFGGLIVVGLLVFGGPPGYVTPRTFVLLPLMILAVLRFGPWGASLAVVLLTLLAVGNTTRGYGPFAVPGPTAEERTLALKSYVSVTALSLLVLASALAERRRAEEELVQRQLHEKQLVAAQLRQAQDELVHSTRLATIGKVAASIAHDLRNSLGAIRNAAFLLQRRLPPGDADAADYLALVQDELVATERIVSNLLETARPKEPVKERVDLVEMVRAELARLNPPAEVACRLEAPAEPVWAAVDRVQLRQVLDNLLQNALDAVGDAGRVTVTIQRVAGSVEITVGDSGRGVRPEHRASLFVPLFTTKARGTGLGLWICRQLVERHGGTIDLVEGPGATFRIRLPA